MADVYLYTTCSVLTAGCPVYSDSGRTTPAANGVYYDGTTCWTVSGGLITGTGTCAAYSCGGGSVTGTYSGSDYHLYPDRTISTTSNPISIISWDVISRPNRFSVYDNNGLITSSGWVGTATYAGPWGASLSTPSSGNIYFTFATTNGRYVRVEAGPADPGAPISDSYTWNLSCVTTTTTTTAAPTTTTTTTSTTTTTTTSAYDFYLAEEYICTDCSFQQKDVLVAFPVGTSISIANRYYRPNTPTGFVYKNFTSSLSSGPGLIMTTTGNSLSCNTACGNTTTTTTTTTSTTTTTTTATPTTTTSTTTTTTTTGGALVSVYNSSLDIPITDITVDGVSVTYQSGANFPIAAGDNGFFTTTQLGSRIIRVYYGAGISAQHVGITDSSSAYTCCNTNGGSGVCIMSSADVSESQAIIVDAADGLCS